MTWDVLYSRQYWRIFKIWLQLEKFGIYVLGGFFIIIIFKLNKRIKPVILMQKMLGMLRKFKWVIEIKFVRDAIQMGHSKN